MHARVCGESHEQLETLEKHANGNFGYDWRLLLKWHVSLTLFMLSLVYMWMFICPTIKWKYIKENKGFLFVKLADQLYLCVI